MLCHALIVGGFISPLIFEYSMDVPPLHVFLLTSRLLDIKRENLISAKSLKRMVGVTGIEPVTPTMSM